MAAMLPNHPLKAIVWDFDGTLADTRRRNLSVNRRIVQEMTGRPWQDVAGLASVEAYEAAWMRVGNWQELYTSAFGLEPEQCEEAAQRWAPYQLDARVEVPLFDGIDELLVELKAFPQAVVSQNDRAIIAEVLARAGVDHFFTAIVGYAEVPMDRQKPAPDGLLRALDILGIEEPATAMYVGDHESDVICASNANRDLLAMGHELWFRTVAAHFLDRNNGAEWSVSPDHRVFRPSELGQLIADLPVDQPDG
jgi:HAD superfamily hydrolase (TIGR01549 family)